MLLRNFCDLFNSEEISYMLVETYYPKYAQSCRNWKTEVENMYNESMEQFQLSIMQSQAVSVMTITRKIINAWHRAVFVCQLFHGALQLDL